MRYPIMPGLVPGILGFVLIDKARRGWPGQPCHDKEQFQAIFLAAIVTCRGTNSRLNTLVPAA
jgi:hypothetical protein